MVSAATMPQWPYLKTKDPDNVALRAPLAQLAEQLTLNQRVGGSIPSRRTFLLVRGTLALAAGSRPHFTHSYHAKQRPLVPPVLSPLFGRSKPAPASRQRCWERADMSS